MGGLFFEAALCYWRAELENLLIRISRLCKEQF
jgi:hypothetical protein